MRRATLARLALGTWAVLLIAIGLSQGSAANIAVVRMTKAVFVDAADSTWLPADMDCRDLVGLRSFAEPSNRARILDVSGELLDGLWPGMRGDLSARLATPLGHLQGDLRNAGHPTVFITDHSSEPLTVFAHGMAEFYSGHKVEAALIWREEPQIAQFFVGAGHVCSRRGRHRAEIANYETALSIDESLIGLYERISFAYGALGEVERANEAMDRAAQSAPTELAKLIFAGRAALQRGAVQQAIALFSQAETLQPSALEPRFRHGLALFYANDYVGAVAQLQLASALGPDDWQVYYYLGRAYSAQDSLELAEAALQRAVTLAPANVDCRVWLAEVMVARGDCAGGETELENASRLSPQDSRLQSLQARVVACR